MDKSVKIQAYYEQSHPLQDLLEQLRGIVLYAGLEEDYKWSLPTYTWKERNIAGIALLKAHCGLWFFQGALLTDPLGVLDNAQEGKTRAMRHWKFRCYEDLDRGSVIAYLQEAVHNEELGRRIPIREQEEIALPHTPELLDKAFIDDPGAHRAFEALSRGKRREYLEYLHEAKREATRMRRLEKILPMIREGKGLHDNYRL